MSRFLTMPRLGETMEEGTLQAWLVAPGQRFKRGETIAEVETDKTLVEVPALEDGEILSLLVQEGEVVPVGAPLAELKGEGTATPEASQPPSTAEAVPATPEATPKAATPVPVSADKVAAAPAARRLAARMGVQLSEVTGSGRRGRIQGEDVIAAAAGARPEGELYAKRLGPVNAETIVFLHGFASDADTWANIQLPLSIDRQTIAFDLPGHGRSFRHPAIDGPQAMVRAVKGALERLGIERFHLVGHSMGGAVAAVLALEHGAAVDSLTLLAPAGLGLEVNHRLLRRLAGSCERETIAVILEQFVGWDSRLPSGLADHIARQRRDPEVTVKLEAVLERLLDGNEQKRLPAEKLKAPPFPVRLIWGTMDAVVPIKQAEALHSAALSRFEGIGHLPHIERPQEVIELIRRNCSEAEKRAVRQGG